MRPALEALAARLREEAEVSGEVARSLAPGDDAWWVAEQRAYEDAAIIVQAAAQKPGGLGRVRTVVELHALVGRLTPGTLVWLRVGAMVERRCASRRPRGVKS